LPQRSLAGRRLVDHQLAAVRLVRQAGCEVFAAKVSRWLTTVLNKNEMMNGSAMAHFLGLVINDTINIGGN
jgi:hypothetical protein